MSRENDAVNAALDEYTSATDSAPDNAIVQALEEAASWLSDDNDGEQ